MPDPAEIMAKAGRENFPVAALFLPRSVRRHLLNLYGFARLVDELGDEVSGDRLELLDWLEAELENVYGGSACHPLMRRLAPTVRRFAIPKEPFLSLIEANRQDQVISRYATFAELERYCALSANPVGRLVLLVMECATSERFALSDSICTGLQLTEHWQDVREDLARGRMYVPQEDLARFGVTVADIERGDVGPAFRRLMAFEALRARQLLDRGAPLANTLKGRLKLAVAAFVAGGRSALGAIERAGYDVLNRSPRPSRLQRLAELVRIMMELRRG